jgi:DNA-directed RNA polymerase subunit RPC12/RpoP
MEMYCLNCGKELQDGSKFCPYCGSKTESTERVMISEMKSTQFPDANNQKYLKALRVMSIIGIIWFPLMLSVLSSALSSAIESEVKDAFPFVFMVFGYAVAHSIVAVKQGLKYNLTSLTVMGILGILLYIVSSIITIIGFGGKANNAYDEWPLIGCLYGLSFSIVALVKSKLKVKE